MMRVFIGYDSREPIAYHVLAHSILSQVSGAVSITPLALHALRLTECYWREPDPLATTEFTLTRFLVPYLCDYEGLAVFMDCDMLCQTDISRLAVLSELHGREWFRQAVWVCQHDYTPKTTHKMDGQIQTTYPRKNWSSLMVFNNAKCRALTPHVVNTATPAFLHRFEWLTDDEIGSLPLEYNWLVGEYPPNSDAKILHYTLGGPWFDNHRHCDHAEDWFAARDLMMTPAPRPRTLADMRVRRG